MLVPSVIHLCDMVCKNIRGKGRGFVSPSRGFNVSNRNQYVGVAMNCAFLLVVVHWESC